ncbi:MAG: restriction endonuclease subunit S [Clostridia bacterium]|nr:restriction endonuclease subunit S [Clostridia bacterium]
MTEYRLEKLFDLQMGKTPSRNNPEYWTSEDHKWISIGDLSKCGKYISETKEYLSDKAVEESGISLIPEKTVVMSFKLAIGKTAITAEPMYSNEAIMSFRDRHLVELLPDYVYYLLSGRDWDEGTNKAVMGKTLNKATLSKIKVKIHGIEQQRDIVSVLDNVSSIITARQQQLSALDDLIKARFVEMFGDPLLTSTDRKKLSDLGQVFTGNTPSMKVPEYYISDDIPFVKPGDIAENDVTCIKKVDSFISENARGVARIIPPNSVLVTCIGTIGKIGINESECCCNQQINYIVPKKEVLPIYLACCISFFKEVLTDMANAPVVPIINKTQFSAIEVPVAQYDEQNQFADFVKQIDKSKVAVQKALDESQLLFDSLMQKYFG